LFAGNRANIEAFGTDLVPGDLGSEFTGGEEHERSGTNAAE
jgi:hypothetical protein